MPVSLGPLSLHVDHVAFASNDLSRALSAVQALGLSSTAMGEACWPTGDGQMRARTLSIVVSDGYIDIIEDRQSRRLDEPEERAPLWPTGVILRSEDLVESREVLIESGVRCGRPYAIDRLFSKTGSDQHYEIFGTAEKHRSGLPFAVIQTTSSQPMENESEHRIPVRGVSDAATRLGFEL